MSAFENGARTCLVRAVLLVAAVYVYFLIFAEFAFIELARPVVGDGDGLRVVMGALGAGGAVGSGLAAFYFSRPAWGPRLAGWLAAGAVAAATALLAPAGGVSGLVAAGVWAGLALGGATVTLAAGLSGVAPRGRLGLATGLGTGIAYAFCNLPGVFDAEPATQTLLAAGSALVGAITARSWTLRGEVRRLETASVGGWVVALLALVWMDSAAFYIIQHTDTLKTATWAGAWTLGGNAAAHFAAAVLAGWALDRGRAVGLVAAAAVLLALACLWLQQPRAELVYVAGVSLYSAALVYVPARCGRPGCAAATFALAGWGGSALGIGMAQDLNAVPPWFAGLAVAAVTAGLWRVRRAGAVLAASLAAGAVVGAGDLQAEESAVERGRAVYVAEGCIHCHSQYVRPGTTDVERWGPERPLDELLKQRPPLFGNRRQGPDLLNVGNRRTPEWNRLHLIDPQAVSPGSIMPAYARLFVDGERSGEDLLAYLASLGEATAEARAEQVAAWRPEASTRADGGLGASWFARACVQCHGHDGRGAGPLAGRLSTQPADLSRRRSWDDVELARLIKFGRPGTVMAGHEALGDDALVSLARYVKGLSASGANP